MAWKMALWTAYNMQTSTKDFIECFYHQLLQRGLNEIRPLSVLIETTTLKCSAKCA